MKYFQTFGGFQIFSCQSTFLKVIGFHLKVIKTNFLERGYRDFRLFKLISVIFRFFHEELNLMPEYFIYNSHFPIQSR